MDKRILHVWNLISNDYDSMLGVELFDVFLQKGLTIRFKDPSDNIFEVIYDQLRGGSYILSMRFVEESNRPDLLQLVIDAQSKYQELGLKGYSSFYKMENSDFFEWFDGVAIIGSQDIPHVEHHVYITSDLILEVLSEYEPRVNKIE